MKSILIAVALAVTFGACVEASGQSSYGDDSYQTYYRQPRPYYYNSYYQPRYGADWGYWSECTASCGGGEQTRTRICYSRQQGYSGYTAGYNSGYNGGHVNTESCGSETRECNDDLCPVDGGWSDWGDYSECSNQCGYGEKTRERTCTEPEPANGGRDCYGPPEESTHCHEYKCPADGGWSYWGPFSYCSEECGGGEKIRERTCTHPAPSNGGADCEGDSEEIMSCNEHPCPVDGMWSEWEEFSECSASCGGGEKSRQRYCNNPEPQYEGEDCEGDDEETMSCNEDPCPVDGEWGDWSEWSKCSGYCGEGERTRSRNCDSPAPAYKGDDCEGDDSETETCKHYIPCYAPRGYNPQGHGPSDGY